jgi:hypothetical protein
MLILISFLSSRPVKVMLGIGVDEGLLIDTSDALHVAYVERILRPAIARTFPSVPMMMRQRPAGSLPLRA